MLATLPPPASYLAPTSTDVAWRPDGHALATPLLSDQPDTDHIPAKHAIVLYDCQSDKQITWLVPGVNAQLADGAGSGGTGATGPMFLWSPDGTRLLLVDSSLGTMTIWGPGALPH